MVSPQDQGAASVGLFFDLVFAFAITQVTHYASHHLDVVIEQVTVRRRLAAS